MSFTPLAETDLEEIGDYVILYQPAAPDVLIVRVLHGAMDLPRHIGNEDT